ncbi:MAG: hypothetical protein ABIJ74_04205 [archaeon]
MVETDYEEIKKSILMKKKQGMREKDIIKFLELAGYPLRLLEEVNRELEKGEENNKGKENKGNPIITKIAAGLFGITSLIELLYFFLLVPAKKYSMAGPEFIPLLVMLIFVILSALIAYGLFYKKYWGISHSSTVIFLRMLLLGYLVLMKYEFFIFIIAVDVILMIVLLLVKPFFEKTKLKTEQENMMEEVEKHEKGTDKKEIWEN